MAKGFAAFQYYNAVKNHLKSGKFNLLDGIGKQDFVKKNWDRLHDNVKGSYHAVEKYLPKRKENYQRCFAYYWLRNKDYFITDILKDEFRLYEEMEFNLRNIETTVKIDFIYILDYCRNKNRKLKNILYANKVLPVIIQMLIKNKISVFSFLVIDKIFKVFEKINKDNLTSDQKAEYRRMKIIVDKFSLLMYNDMFIDRDWKTFIKTII